VDRRVNDNDSATLVYRGWAAMNSAYSRSGLQAFKQAETFFMQALEQLRCRWLGLLPPPLRGRGGEGGGHKCRRRRLPPSLSLPRHKRVHARLGRAKGGGNRASLAFVLLPLIACLGSGSSALAQTPALPQPRITIAVVDIEGDPRHEPIRAYE